MPIGHIERNLTSLPVGSSSIATRPERSREIYREPTRPARDFGNNIPYSDYLAAFSQTRIPVKWPNAAPNLEPRDDIWPTDRAPVIRREDGTNEFSELRWGFPPARPKGAPVINFRSEGRRFPVGRCLVPASHFFEFTGTKSPKTKWKFTKADDDWFCFAGLWRPMAAGGEAFTLLTTEPSPDVAPIHDRRWSCWSAPTGRHGWSRRATRPISCGHYRQAP